MGIGKLTKKIQYSYELEMAKRIYTILPTQTEQAIRKRVFQELKPESRWNFYDVAMIKCCKLKEDDIHGYKAAFLYNRIIKAIACIYANQQDENLDEATKNFCALKGSSRGYEKEMLEDVSKLLNFSENAEILGMAELAYQYESKMYKDIEKSRRLFHSKPREVREKLLLEQRVESMKQEGCSKEAIEDEVKRLTNGFGMVGSRSRIYTNLRNDLYLDLAIENMAKNYPESFKGVDLDLFKEVVTTRGLNGIYKEANGSQAQNDDASEK